MNEQQEEKEEKLELVFGTEKLSDSIKETFIGKVVYAEYPCHCEDCEKGARKLEAMFASDGREGEKAPDRLHIRMKPLTEYDKEQSQWWIPTKTKLSKWGTLQVQLEKLGIIEQFKTERHKAFMGMVAEWVWTEIPYGAKAGDTTSHWIPSRLLTEDEASALVADKVLAKESSGTSEEGTKLD